MTAWSFGDLANAAVGYRNPDRTHVPRRDSYDIADPRAQVFRPAPEGWDFIGAVLQAFDELLHDQRTTRYKEDDRLQDGDRRILLSFMKLLDFRTGQLDPSYQQVADRAGCHRATVITAFKRFQKWLGLGWVRRTVKAETAGEAGPQREQISNAFFFDLAKAPHRVWQTFKAALARRRIKRQGKAPAPPEPPKTPINPQLSAALDLLGEAIERREGASRKSRHYPGEGI